MPHQYVANEINKIINDIEVKKEDDNSNAAELETSDAAALEKFNSIGNILRTENTKYKFINHGKLEQKIEDLTHRKNIFNKLNNIDELLKYFDLTQGESNNLNIDDQISKDVENSILSPLRTKKENNMPKKVKEILNGKTVIGQGRDVKGYSYEEINCKSFNEKDSYKSINFETGKVNDLGTFKECTKETITMYGEKTMYFFSKVNETSLFQDIVYIDNSTSSEGGARRRRKSSKKRKYTKKTRKSKKRTRKSKSKRKGKK